MTSDPAGILVVAETEQGRVVSTSLELLGLARRLCDELGGSVSAVVLGRDLDRIGTELVSHGADRVYLADDAALAEYQADAWLPELAETVRVCAPAAILLGHSTMGGDLAPRLAFRLDAAVTTACVRVTAEAGRFLFTRPCYGGNALEVASFKTEPVVATIKPKTHEALAADPARGGEVIKIAATLAPEAVRTRVIERIRDEPEGLRLEDADVIVAGGGGMKGPEGFAMARELADLLRGAVGASRVACDLGWCPPSYQIGLSGRTVAPSLYIAVGISGAGHHMAGCSNSKAIVAINSDAEAPIFKAARFGIVADCHEFLPALIEKIKAHKG